MKNSRNFWITWGGYGLAAVLGVLLLVQAEVQPQPKVADAVPLGVSRKLGPSPSAAPASDGKPKVAFDSRTSTLMDELEVILAEARPGEVNDKFQEKAWETLLDNDAERRSRNFGLLLEVLQPGDGLALHRMFQKAHKEGRDYAEEYARFATRWGQIDGSGVLRHYFEEGSGASPADVHNALKGWATQNPESAMAWAVANRQMLADKPHPAFGPQEDPVFSVLRGWARLDPAAATAALNAQYTTQEERRQPVRMMFVESLFGRGLDSTLDWMKQLPESQLTQSPVGQDLFRETFRRMSEASASPEQVARNFVKFADQPWVGINQLDFLSHQFENSAAAITQELSSPTALPVMEGKFSGWAAEDPGTVGDWLNRNRGSALYDVGAASLARSLQSSDPASAATWAKTIKDTVLRAKAGG